MAIPIHIPKLGMTMSEGLLTEWKVREGDSIQKGQVVLAIETEKISWEVEAPGGGLIHIMAAKGTSAKVGAIVAYLAETVEELESLRKEYPFGTVTEAKAAAEPPRPATHAAASAPAIEPREGDFVPSSPAARRLAKELGVDIASVAGTGKGGRVTEEDVRRYHEEGPPPPNVTPLAAEIARQAGVDLAGVRGTGDGGKITREDVEKVVAARKKVEAVKPVTSIPYTGLRRAVARNMHASLHNTAQVTTFVETDVTEMVRFRETLREEFKKDESVRISYNDIVVLAVSRALKRFPIMNSTLVGEEILLHDSVNMGVAVAVPGGLVVPVLHDADKKGLLRIGRETRELAIKARDNALTVDDMTGGTFTISNVSMFDVDGATPILKPPETGILGVGRVKEKPAVYRGQICIRSLMFLCLTFDHQVVDGAPASDFLRTVAKYLEQPGLIMAY